VAYNPTNDWNGTDRPTDGAARERGDHAADLADAVTLCFEVERRCGERRAIAAGHLERRVGGIIFWKPAVGIIRIVAEEPVTKRLMLDPAFTVLWLFVLVGNRYSRLRRQKSSLRANLCVMKIRR
jgi:hypothetical protein